MKYLIALFSLFIMSCGTDKVVLLPEISHSETTEVLDVSPAYLFYNETKTDSIELNRKNLIITTNWLVNVDRRLTLKQAIPQIIYLQNKKRNAKMHKNEAAKNYFTCNNTSIKNLGFVEFTNIYYHTKDIKKPNTVLKKNSLELNIESLNDIKITGVSLNSAVIESNIKSLKNELKKLQTNNTKSIVLNFKKSLTFQDYISIKSLFLNFKIDNTTISNNEYIY